MLELDVALVDGLEARTAAPRQREEEAEREGDLHDAPPLPNDAHAHSVERPASARNSASERGSAKLDV